VAYPWYDIIEDLDKNDLQQGDFVFKCPVIIPSFSEEIVDDLRSGKEINCARVKSEVYDLIIVTQSCDLINKKARFILLCPIWPLKYAEQKQKDLKSSKEKERVRRGYRRIFTTYRTCESSST